MLKRRMAGVLCLVGIVAAGATPAAMALGEPGDEYIFILDEANTSVGMVLGDVQDYTPLHGWISLYLDANDPLNGRCIMGDAEAISTEDIIMLIWPGQIEAYLYAGHLQFYDFDLWYQDPNEWNRDPNLWPDPNDAQDANDADDPNWVDPWNNGMADPNDPNYNSNGPDDPNDFDPNYNRWADLVGGFGMLNTEILFHWGYEVVIFGEWDEGASTEWTSPFGPWTVQLTDNGGSMDAVIDWTAWIKSSDFPAQVPIHLEGTGGLGQWDLDVTLTTPDKGKVLIDPDLPRKFPNGVEVTLEAVPNPTRGFKKWKITDPNGVVTEDTNSIITITMDGDYDVEAVFKCSSSSSLMPLGVVLLVLTMGVVIRRFR